MFQFALHYLCIVLTLRLLPFAVYAALSRSLPALARVSAGLGYAGVVGGCVALGAPLTPLWVALGAAYYGLVSLALRPASEWLKRGRIVPVTVFVACAVLYLFVPAILLPGIAAAFLVVG